eukprot:6201304-Pleurochrysis_carterae.AAC.1
MMWSPLPQRYAFDESLSKLPAVVETHIEAGAPFVGRLAPLFEAPPIAEVRVVANDGERVGRKSPALIAAALSNSGDDRSNQHSGTDSLRIRKLGVEP